MPPVFETPPTRLPALRSALVVGGSGFLGRAVSARLRREGAAITWAVSATSTTVAPAGIAINHDFWSITPAKREMVLSEFDAVVYVAGRTTPSSAGNTITFECEENLRPLAIVLDSLPNFDWGRMVYVSSAGALQGAGSQPLSEDSPLSAQSLYGAGKIAAEAFLNAWAHAGGAALTILRPSNVYGPQQRLRAGFGLIRTVLEGLARDREIPVYRNGADRRDYLFIDDFTEAVWRALHGPTGAYNVAAGTSHTILEVIRTAEEVTGKRARLVMRSDTRSPATDVLLSTERIQRALGWSAGVDLATGIERTWRWLGDQP